MNKDPLGPGVTVVAIDDDLTTLELVKAALKQQPLEILTASGPEAGLELVFRERPQIVLLDLMMPKLGGMDLLDRIVDAAPRPAPAHEPDQRRGAPETGGPGAG